MKYVLTVLLFAVSWYLFSFARYNWAKKNKLAAVGAVLIGITAISLSFFVIFSNKYEIG